MPKGAKNGVPAPPRARARLTPLQTIRMARTITQDQLALLVEITQQTLSKYETGELIPPPDQRAKIATVLGTSSEVLWPPRQMFRMY